MWSREIPDFNYDQNAMIMSNIKYCIRIGILFLAGIIVFGCNEDRQNEKDSDIFQINIPLTSGDKPLFADSLFCGKEIVPLETTPECLISQIDKLEIADDKLYLLDDEQDFIFIFSRQGKFFLIMECIISWLSVLYALNGRKVTVWILIRYEKVKI